MKKPVEVSKYFKMFAITEALSRSGQQYPYFPFVLTYAGEQLLHAFMLPGNRQPNHELYCSWDKTKLFIKPNSVIYKLNSNTLRTGTRSLATNTPLKTVSDCFYIAAAEELKLVFSIMKRRHFH